MIKEEESAVRSIPVTAQADESEIGSRLREVRHSQYRTLREVAVAAEVSESFLSQVERAKVSASVATLQRVAVALGVTIGYLVAVVSKAFAYHLGGLVIAIICAAQLIALGSATSDSGRALFVMAEKGLTIRRLEKLKRHDQPARGMTVDLVFNFLVLFLVSYVAGIIFASILGYLLTFFALAGFLLLRFKHLELVTPPPVQGG